MYRIDFLSATSILVFCSAMAPVLTLKTHTVALCFMKGFICLKGAPSSLKVLQACRVDIVKGVNSNAIHSSPTLHIPVRLLRRSGVHSSTTVQSSLPNMTPSQLICHEK
ncbi:hypothetical protein PF005_g20191 [Phytophthora fragariae]|uniref:Uncharacterized protein n=1 Tax=Phytophthora fragariae TaxID=53985 RepID=A0A6A3WNP4_9STRA|nr:hypothetical protein PF003_g15089 [Phytophthora fragariae]KAE8937037.1 hypothetical protein PF009_g13048 [Phytophthora fragariae]KAE8994058.1 hypothetical protein PF011_g16884 [Phytophthora fragariae]KAE9105532.1 hypothetical protein PF007_g13674 [Phytophthora fragariae]KAE9106230.1 hypothetical protein PF010_g12690 [Phytophthora fragariae]